MLRQNDNVRISERCYKPTTYYKSCYQNKDKYINRCIYLENGKCTLNYCIRKLQK